MVGRTYTGGSAFSSLTTWPMLTKTARIQWLLLTLIGRATKSLEKMSMSPATLTAIRKGLSLSGSSICAVDSGIPSAAFATGLVLVGLLSMHWIQVHQSVEVTATRRSVGYAMHSLQNQQLDRHGERWMEGVKKNRRGRQYYSRHGPFKQHIPGP